MSTYVEEVESLKKRLTPIQYNVTREKGTEKPFTGCYDKFFQPGTYTCLVCEEKLFSSEAKYDSKSGWPSFFKPLTQDNLKLTPDVNIEGTECLEIACQNCGSHLGHLMEDGPNPTGKRYCINSASLKFNAY